MRCRVRAVLSVRRSRGRLYGGQSVCHSALSFDVARSAHLHVSLGDGKTVGGRCHQLKAFAGVFGYLAFRHEYTITLALATPNASAQLMGCESPKRSAFSMSMVVAFGTFTPSSITVVATRMWASCEAKDSSDTLFPAASSGRERKPPYNRGKSRRYSHSRLRATSGQASHFP